MQYYTILGQRVGSHIVPSPPLPKPILSFQWAGALTQNKKLAIATLSTITAVSALAMRGGGKGDSKTPPIQASSGDEERFIKYLPPQPVRLAMGARG